MASISGTKSQVITCKAAVIWGAGEVLKIEEIQVDPPQKGEVRIKMLIASLCHTDLLSCAGFPIPLFPRAPGHEGVGMVESVGEGVLDLEKGDIIIPTYLGECGECLNCQSQKTNLCHKHSLPMSGLMPDGTSRMSVVKNNDNGRQNRQILYQIFSCSTFSEYTVVDANYVVKLNISEPDNKSLAQASFLSCGYSTGFGGAWKEAKVHKGSSVAVFGLGAVGLGVIDGARLQGASKIIGVDINTAKHEKGKAFGMTDFINPNAQSELEKKPISEMVKDLTGGIGVDYCFECSGVKALIQEAIDSTKAGLGTTVLIGVGAEGKMEFHMLSVMFGRTIKGCLFGNLRPKSDLPYIFDKWLNQELNLDELWTAEYQVKLEDINNAFKLMKQPDCVKVIIKF